MSSHCEPHYILPDSSSLAAARSKLIKRLASSGLGLEATKSHLFQDIIPAFSQSSKSATYYGFVTGGSTPAATYADNLVTEYDQNAAVHLPNDSIATEVEDAALQQLLELVKLSPRDWSHRTFTTGATASNVLGLACGRESILIETGKRYGVSIDPGSEGIARSMRLANVDDLQILSSAPHSSLRKAASIVGVGRANVLDLGRADAPHRFDFELLKEKIATPRTLSIVSVSCAEINTGFFATNADDMQILRQLCDQFGAWLHIDAAFGLQARLLPGNSSEFAAIVAGVQGLELADSIAGDAHKLLNVPYDCGIFFSRHLNIAESVFQNAGAAYLQTGDGDIPSPLNIGIENSRRLRALPVYATLSCHGQSGYQDMLERQIRLARQIARFVDAHPSYELLPRSTSQCEAAIDQIYMCVLLRVRDESRNKTLVARINASRRIYVSGTSWEGRPAARFAVSNWQVDPEHDIAIIREVLESVVA